MFADDILVLRADPTALPKLIDQAGLRLLGAKDLENLKAYNKDDDLEAMEVIVTQESLLVGRTVADLHLRQTYEVNMLAVRAVGRSPARLLDRRFVAGDVVILQGRTSQLQETIERLGCLPLAERNLAIGRPRSRYLPLVILATALVLISTGVVQVELGFFAAATLILLLRLITVREAYDSIDWPVIVMLGSLLPVGESLKETGTAQLLADLLSHVAVGLPGILAVGLIMVVSMLVTPFLHHAAAVLVMGPVAASVAHNLGFAPDPFLMAVAFGAACDFLTPIGHQNSTLVMRPAGYRFGDYWRLGLPLTILVGIVGTWLIVLSWPL
jgi:di/tricarboxylate transporter